MGRKEKPMVDSRRRCIRGMDAVIDYGWFLNWRQEQIYILKLSVSITASITRRIHWLIS
jgi:hypothetical protein